MDSMFTLFLYAIAIVLLFISFAKDRKKTFTALKRAWKMFISVLPQFTAIVLLVGILLVVFTPEMIQLVIGKESGFWGMLIASMVGSITLVPVLIAFPISAELLQNGAGIAQISVFISTLTTVGIITLPLETKYLGRKAAMLRNALAFFFAFASACIMGAVIK